MKTHRTKLYQALCLAAIAATMASGAACGDANAVIGEHGDNTSVDALTSSPVASGFVIHTIQKPQAGKPVNVRVRAIDANGGRDANYVGLASASSSDATAVLPPALAFTTFDKGEVTFKVTFSQAGTQHLSVIDGTGRQAQRQLDVQPSQSGCNELLPVGAECKDANASCCGAGLICADFVCVPDADPSDI